METGEVLKCPRKKFLEKERAPITGGHGKGAERANRMAERPVEATNANNVSGAKGPMLSYD